MKDSRFVAVVIPVLAIYCLLFLATPIDENPNIILGLCEIGFMTAAVLNLYFGIRNKTVPQIREACLTRCTFLGIAGVACRIAGIFLP